MARGIFGAINTMARAAERASREQDRESIRLIKENERNMLRTTSDAPVWKSNSGNKIIFSSEMRKLKKLMPNSLNGWNSYARFYFAPSIATRA